MSGTEQREHRTVTQAIAKRLTDTQIVVDELAHSSLRKAKRIDDHDEAIHDVQSSIEQLRTMQDVMLKEFRMVQAAIISDANMTRWQRLRWLWSGR